jgi:hypothetical protein
VSKEVIGKLGAALDKALDDPVVVKRLADLGASIPTKKKRNPTSFDRLVKAENVRWSPILKAASATQNGVGGCPSRRGRLYADIDLTPAAARVIGVSGLAHVPSEGNKERPELSLETASLCCGACDE